MASDAGIQWTVDAARGGETARLNAAVWQEPGRCVDVGSEIPGMMPHLLQDQGQAREQRGNNELGRVYELFLGRRRRFMPRNA
jgi:hypothetical protein